MQRINEFDHVSFIGFAEVEYCMNIEILTFEGKKHNCLTFFCMKTEDQVQGLYEIY
jgi:hypothetical protein